VLILIHQYQYHLCLIARLHLPTSQLATSFESSVFKHASSNMLAIVLDEAIILASAASKELSAIYLFSF